MTDEPDFLIDLIFHPGEPNARPSLGEMQLLLAYVIELLKEALDDEEQD